MNLAFQGDLEICRLHFFWIYTIPVKYIPGSCLSSRTNKMKSGITDDILLAMTVGWMLDNKKLNMIIYIWFVYIKAVYTKHDVNTI